eukprot:7738654-Alexandrium_andersonii.AAC.1
MGAFCAVLRGDSESAHESGPRGGSEGAKSPSRGLQSAIRQSAIRATLASWRAGSQSHHRHDAHSEAVLAAMLAGGG